MIMIIQWLLMQHDAAESCELPGQMQTLAMAVHEAASIHPDT